VAAVDAVFKALADPTRREILDSLFDRSGQALTELEEPLPMSRFGVMKHLTVLEEAGLVLTRRRGRQKLHFLNAVPIRLVYERWVSKFEGAWSANLSQLKKELEDEPMDQPSSTSFAEGSVPITDSAVFEIYIKTSPERLWEAITDDEMRRRYNFGVGISSEWTAGSGYESTHPMAPGPISAGENLEVDPPHRLVQSFNALWDEDVEKEGTSRVTWEIEPVGDSCRLTVVHDRLGSNPSPALYGGWPMILSGLKTLLESGETLDTPGSLRFAE
jgi:uncharacterized protein YndB with AHSA1/START domain/DNA-binding transcriptional ArsR family regulator